MNKTTKITAGVAGGVLVLGIIGAAISDSDDEQLDAAQPTTSQTQPTSEPTSEPAPVDDTVVPAFDEPAPTAEPDYETLAETVFLNQVSEHQIPSDEEALLVGYTACALIDSGTTPEFLVYEVMSATEPVVPGFRNDELPMIYGAAIGSLCQRHMHLIEGYQ